MATGSAGDFDGLDTILSFHPCYMDPLCDAARAAFETRTSGGIGSMDWIAPRYGYAPTIHFRRPEYVTTDRGFDRSIPTYPS